MTQNLDTILSTRVSNKILNNIKEIAAERNRKLGDIIREALEMYLAEWADYKIAIDRLTNPDDQILSEEEFIEELGWKI